MKKVLAATLSLTLLSGVVSPFATTKASAATASTDSDSKVEVVYEEKSIPMPTTTKTMAAASTVSANSVYGTKWNYLKTYKYSDKATWTSASAAVSAFGLMTGIKYASLAGIVINWCLAQKGKWVYYSDKRYWRQAGATFQTKHVVTWYKDSKRTKVLKTQEYITNDRGIY